MSFMTREIERQNALADRLMDLAGVGDDATEKARELAEDVRNGEYPLEYAVAVLEENFEKVA